MKPADDKMYTPAHFDSTSLAELRRHVAEYPLAIMVSRGSATAQVSMVPLLFDVDEIVGHIPVSNPHCDILESHSRVTLCFQGADRYISPGFYADSGLVPTWNYVVACVDGLATVVQDNHHILDILDLQTKHYEDRWGVGWRPGDADPNLLRKLLPCIRGLRVRVLDFSVKHKLSQNRDRNDFESVLTALAEKEDGGPILEAMRVSAAVSSRRGKGEE